MSNSSVRDAFVASVAWTRPPVSFQSSQRVDRTGEQLALLGARPHARHLVEDPGELGGGEIRIEQQPGAADQLHGGGIASEHAAALRGAPVLPDDGALHGLPRRAVPHHDRLALHGDADAGHVLGGELGGGERLTRARDGGGEDLVGVVLHPAVGGEVLAERLLHLCEHGAVVGEDHGAGARGAGVEREDGHGADRGVRPRRADGWMGWGQRAPKMRARAKAGKPT